VGTGHCSAGELGVKPPRDIALSDDSESLCEIFHYSVGKQLLFDLQSGERCIVQVHTDDPVTEGDTLIGSPLTGEGAASRSELEFALRDVARVRCWPGGMLLYYRSEAGDLRLIEHMFAVYLRIDLAFKPRWSCQIGGRGPEYVIEVFSGPAAEEPPRWEAWPRHYILPEEKVRLVSGASRGAERSGEAELGTGI
jgi:hypothetical protein